MYHHKHITMSSFIQTRCWMEFVWFCCVCMYQWLVPRDNRAAYSIILQTWHKNARLLFFPCLLLLQQFGKKLSVLLTSYFRAAAHRWSLETRWANCTPDWLLLHWSLRSKTVFITRSIRTWTKLTKSKSHSWTRLQLLWCTVCKKKAQMYIDFTYEIGKPNLKHKLGVWGVWMFCVS